jgi:50S ribosomal subunit-associated GTPase HflX
MLDRRALVIANKIDLIDDEERLADMLASIAEATNDLGIRNEHDVIGISAGVSGDGLGILSKAIRDVVTDSDRDRTIADFDRMKEAMG